MKKIIFLLMISLVFFTGCQGKQKPEKIINREKPQQVTKEEVTNEKQEQGTITQEGDMSDVKKSLEEAQDSIKTIEDNVKAIQINTEPLSDI